MKSSFLVYDIKNQAELIGSINSIMSTNTDADINVFIDLDSNCEEMAKTIVRGCCGQPEPIVVEDGPIKTTTQIRDNRLIRIISYNGTISPEKQILEGLKKAATGETVTLIKGGMKVHSEFYSAINEVFKNQVVGGIFTDSLDNLHYSYYTSLRPNKPFKDNLNNITFRSYFIPLINSGNIFDIIKTLHGQSIIVHLPEPLFKT